MSAFDPIAVRPPFFPRGGSQAPTRRYTFASETLHRLALLAGLLCPHCGTVLGFDGSRLRCGNAPACYYDWNNADAAENDVYCGLA